MAVTPPPSAPRLTRWWLAAALTGLVAAGWVSLGLLARSNVSTDTIEGRVTRIEIDIDHGDVVVRGAGREVVVERRSTWRLDEPIVETELDGTTLTLRAECPRGLPFVGSCRSDHVVTVPRTAHVEVRTGHGSVTLSDVHGWVHVTTGSGPVAGENLGGSEILVESLGRDIDLTLDEPSSRVVLASRGGDVRLRIPGGPYDVDLGTGGGEVTVEVETEPLAEATITVSTDGGSVLIGGAEVASSG